MSKMSIYALSGKNFWSKVCLCKKFDKYDVWLLTELIIQFYRNVPILQNPVGKGVGFSNVVSKALTWPDLRHLGTNL